MEWICHSTVNKINNQTFASCNRQYNGIDYLSKHRANDFANFLDSVFASDRELFNTAIKTATDAQKGNLLSRALYFTQSPQVLQMMESAHYLEPDVSFKVGNGFGYYTQNNNSKGLYIVITGRDDSGSFSSDEYTNLFIQNKYNVIAISGKYHGITIRDVQDILHLVRQDDENLKVDGIILGAHGSRHSDNSHSVTLGYNSIKTESLMQAVIQALNISDPISVMLLSCHGGSALTGLQNILPAMSQVYSLASYDELSSSPKLDSNSIIHKDFEIEDYIMFSHCFSNMATSSPVYTLKGQEFGNLVNVAKHLLPQIIFSKEIKKDLVSKLANFIPELQLKYVIDILGNDAQFFVNYHYDSRDIIEDISINPFFITMGIVYYLHKFHFQDLVIKDKQDSSPVLLKSIHQMAANNDIAGLEILIHNNRDIDVTTEDGWTALHFAAHKGHGDVVQKLINAGATVDIQKENGVTALYIAAQEGHGGVAQKLINAGATVDIQKEDGVTALHFAAQEGRGDVVQKLINAGATVDIQEEDGMTALHIAAQEGYVDVIQRLIDAGVTVDIQKEDGMTALEISGNLDETVIQLLIKNAMNAGDARDHQNDNIIAIHDEQISASSKNMDLNKGFGLHITNSSISSVGSVHITVSKISEIAF